MIEPVSKALTAGVAGGIVLALAEGVPPDAMTMMYSLSVAVIGLAALVFKQRRQVAPVADKITNSNLMSKLEDMAYGRGGMFERLDKVDDRIEQVSVKIDLAQIKLAEHGARINHLETRHFGA
jgi:hypothetical protein